MTISKHTVFFVVVISLVSIAEPSTAGMMSNSYRMPSAVISGGGSPMTSASFQTNSTIGQPSATSELMSSSNFYKIHSGFWPTIRYASILSGDINNDGIIDLTDAILALKVLSNITLTEAVFKAADINEDGVIGLAEALHALQIISGLKSHP